MTNVFIGVGSNMRPKENIKRALCLLANQEPFLASSMFYWNDALDTNGDVSDSPRFLNGVWKICTQRSCDELKQNLLSIESQMGRVRVKDKYSDRRIDLDILLFGGDVIRSERCDIPDSVITQRVFVAVPLFELAGNICVPGTDIYLENIVKKMDCTSVKPDEAFSQWLVERISK